VSDHPHRLATPSPPLLRYLQQSRDSMIGSLDGLKLDEPAEVAWWPEERRSTTLGSLLVRVVAETVQQAADQHR
jgi:hypothetical protein